MRPSVPQLHSIAQITESEKKKIKEGGTSTSSQKCAALMSCCHVIIEQRTLLSSGTQHGINEEIAGSIEAPNLTDHRETNVGYVFIEFLDYE